MTVMTMNIGVHHQQKAAKPQKEAKAEVRKGAREKEKAIFTIDTPHPVQRTRIQLALTS